MGIILLETCCNWEKFCLKFEFYSELYYFYKHNICDKDYSKKESIQSTLLSYTTSKQN